MGIKSELCRLYEEINHAAIEQGYLGPMIAKDSDWPSPCEGQTVDGELCVWQLKEQASFSKKPPSFDPLADALAMPFSDEVTEFYASFFANHLDIQFDGHTLQLIQAWNEDDFERLQQNLTGHVLMKRRLKQAESLFIGLTEQEDLLVCVDVATGAVQLEYLGKKPHHTLAPSLNAFLAQAKGVHLSA